MYMTIEDINREYDGQWVYLVELRNGEHGKVIGGTVAAHNENREKVIQVMLEDPNGGVYIFYAGDVPEGVSVLL